MKAWLLESFDGLDALRLADVPEPAPGPGEVLLAVRYAALNPADRYLAEKQYPARPPLPHILGRDAMGTVAALGAGVTGISVGDRVMLLRSEVGVNRAGALAQFVAVPVDALVPAPADWTDQQAAGATLVYLTAWQALTQWGDLPPGVVLITGASGGVGIAALHLARALGHRVIALSRSPEKRQKLLEMGAIAAYDPNDTRWPIQLREELGEQRVDLAIDQIGGPSFADVVSVMGMNGKISVVGRLAGPVPEVNTATLFFRRLRLGGVAASTYTRDESHAAWRQILSHLQRMNVRPVVDSVFEFEQLRQAFDSLQAGPFGKVLVRIASDA